MADLNRQPIPNHPSFLELRRVAYEIARLCEIFVRLMENLPDEKPIATQQLLCDTCPKKGKCKKPCEVMERQLPGKYAGKIHGEGTIDLSLDTIRNVADCCDDLEDENVKKLDQGNLKDVEKVNSLDLFSQYEACWHIFTRKQQEVLPFYYRDGKTITQIAKQLHKCPSTTWGLLFRAEKRKQKYYGKPS